MLALDVVEDILLTQDMRDLLRWKSVCKSWYSLISSPLFVKRHLIFVREKEDNDNKQLGNRRIDVGYCNSSNIEGSSNGLVCMSNFDNYEICLTNPSTRELRVVKQPRTLPKSVRKWGLESEKCARCYGFGYDSSADDYKLVMAMNYQGSNETLVHILSLKSNVWKLFGHVNYSVNDSNPGILFNGALHWFWHKDNENGIRSIVCFDLAKEEFREIPQPEDPKYYPYDSKLGIFEDHLCILPISLRYGRYGGFDDTWVMKNYNVKQSWELLPTDCEMNNRIYFMNEDCRLETPSYFCSDAGSSDSPEHMSSPIFVQTLVSPNVKSARHKEKRKRLMTQEVEGEGGKK